MDQATLVKNLRQEIADQEEPYRFDDPGLFRLMEEAIGDYSKYRPARKKGSISLVPEQTEYPLPEDYQTWISGLEDYEVVGDMLYLDFTPSSSDYIPFIYLSDHDIDSAPTRDAGIILDYCMWKLLETIVREGAEISGLKLGKGLDIKFQNFDQIREEASKRKDSYLCRVQVPVGGWS
jgi:hypothetical protein